ncbi:DUF1963 domain-containing protein [Spirillospora sp. NPDC052269]
MDVFAGERAELRRLCSKFVADDVARQVFEIAAPAMRIEPGGSGRSRFGGPGLLDAGVDWPEWNGIPLTLLAVLDLAELPGPDVLPREGVLNVFHYDPDLPSDVEWPYPDFGDGCAVLLSHQGQEVPAPERATAFVPQNVRFEPVLTLPDRFHQAWKPLRIAGGYGDSDHLFARLADGLDDLIDEWGETHKSCHQLGGWPAAIHNDPREDAVMARGPADWRLLLQLITDGRMLTTEGHQSWSWADCGYAYFMLPRPAAWEDTALITQG